MWQALAAPGLGWLVLLFLVPVLRHPGGGDGSAPSDLSAAGAGMESACDGTPEPFGEVFSGLFGGQTGLIALRTVAYVVIASVMCVIIGYPVAYFVARKAGKRKGLFLVLILAPFWINYLMRMLAWVNLLSNDGLVNTALQSVGLSAQNWLGGQHSTVILGLVYGYLPFFILPLYSALDRIDHQVLEAARDLGASATGRLLSGDAAPLPPGSPGRSGHHHAPDVRRLLHAQSPVGLAPNANDRQSDRPAHQPDHEPGTRRGRRSPSS